MYGWPMFSSCPKNGWSNRWKRKFESIISEKEMKEKKQCLCYTKKLLKDRY